MIWFILGLFITIIVTVFVCIDDWNDLADKIAYSFIALLVSVIAATLVWLLSSGIVSTCVEIKYDKVSDTQIIALKDNQNVSGSFYIMGGYVDEELYYYYATETEFGYKTEKISSDNTYIKYTNEKPHIEKYSGDFANDIWYWLATPLVSDRYIIYCPENTITTEYVVDLE
jgi:hypothetical protein